ncbi:TPA: oligosaccharide repeat unit polymerase [Streptococcus suis]|nr:oligosaccharide repeat unit polymerase [Streptococcus suis]HEL2312518.1 oligosaccharide repeat unit polymerase [Streptococcus suis]HEM2671177.1 oligosaccharide repeat unit polymerase [Streptococcus suis]HEM2714438.1 oligosaccharide repeat unit polymerase [Streptococcus suis]HEP1783617.1 oligosaccharide repeat unit polymerase [Streptococcus suis]
MYKNNQLILSFPKNEILLLVLAFIGIGLNSLMLIITSELRSKIMISLIFITISYLYIFYLLLKSYKTINFIFLFLLLTIPFSYGQHFIAIFRPDYLYLNQDFHILDGRISDASIISATYFIMIFLILLTFGYMRANTYLKNTKMVNSNTRREGKSIIIVVAMLFLLLSIFSAFKEVIAQYNLSQQYSYLFRRQLELQENYNEVLGVGLYDIYLSKWFIPSLYMFLLVLDKKRHRIIPYIILGVYCSIYFLTGSRFNLLKIFCVVFLIEFIWHRAIKLKHLKVVAIFLVPAIIILGVMSNLRGISSFSIEDIIYSAKKYMNSNPISATLWETGITFTSVSNVIDKVPAQIPFFYGKSYIGSILVCLPAPLRFGFTDNYVFTIGDTLSPLYYGVTNFGYGSSIYAEQFYNFGYFTFIIAILLGIVFGFLEKKLLEFRNNLLLSLFLVVVFTLGELLYSVRNDLYAIPRTVLVSVGFPILVIWIIKVLLVYNQKQNGYLRR